MTNRLRGQVRQGTTTDASTANEALVQIDDVHMSYGSVDVLRGVSLHAAEGSVSCLIGPSGSGKSTLLRCINKLEEISSGSIKVDGHYIGYRRDGDRLLELSDRQVSQQRTQVGMVFQSFNLFPHLTALQNLMLAPVKVQRRPAREVAEEAAVLLERVGLAEKAQSYPGQLSGGQQQRVAIARALAMRPRLMLFDEPTSALDPELVGGVLDVMKDLAASGMTMIVVTHEMAFAREVADQVAFMDDGRVLAVGTAADVIQRPTEARIQDFVRRVSS
jgi:polar amino acid transport system ATP-binding protein